MLKSILTAAVLFVCAAIGSSEALVTYVDLPAADSEQRSGGSFWFGTQSLHCLTHGPEQVYPQQTRTNQQHSSTDNSTAENPAGNARRAVRSLRRSRSAVASPRRADWRYIHRVLFYRDHVFEWGAGARGYFVGPTVAVTDCPTEWEPYPAGYSSCSVDVIRAYAASYKRRYGGYNLLINNCHQFANRVAELLVGNCTNVPQDPGNSVTVDTTTGSGSNAVLLRTTARPSSRRDTGEIVNWAWNIVSWLLKRTASQDDE